MAEGAEAAKNGTMKGVEASQARDEEERRRLPRGRRPSRGAASSSLREKRERTPDKSGGVSSGGESEREVERSRLPSQKAPEEGRDSRSRSEASEGRPAPEQKAAARVGAARAAAAGEAEETVDYGRISVNSGDEEDSCHAASRPEAEAGVGACGDPDAQDTAGVEEAGADPPAGAGDEDEETRARRERRKEKKRKERLAAELLIEPDGPKRYAFREKRQKRERFEADISAKKSYTAVPTGFQLSSLEIPPDQVQGLQLFVYRKKRKARDDERGTRASIVGALHERQGLENGDLGVAGPLEPKEGRGVSGPGTPSDADAGDGVASGPGALDASAGARAGLFGLASLATNRRHRKKKRGGPGRPRVHPPSPAGGSHDPSGAGDAGRPAGGGSSGALAKKTPTGQRLGEPNADGRRAASQLAAVGTRADGRGGQAGAAAADDKVGGSKKKLIPEAQRVGDKKKAAAGDSGAGKKATGAGLGKKCDDKQRNDNGDADEEGSETEALISEECAGMLRDKFLQDAGAIEEYLPFGLYYADSLACDGDLQAKQEEAQKARYLEAKRAFQREMFRRLFYASAMEKHTENLQESGACTASRMRSPRDRAGGGVDTGVEAAAPRASLDVKREAPEKGLDARADAAATAEERLREGLGSAADAGKSSSRHRASTEEETSGLAAEGGGDVESEAVNGAWSSASSVDSTRRRRCSLSPVNKADTGASVSQLSSTLSSSALSPLDARGGQLATGPSLSSSLLSPSSASPSTVSTGDGAGSKAQEDDDHAFCRPAKGDGRLASDTDGRATPEEAARVTAQSPAEKRGDQKSEEHSAHEARGRSSSRAEVAKEDQRESERGCDAPAPAELAAGTHDVATSPRLLSQESHASRAPPGLAYSVLPFPAHAPTGEGCFAEVLARETGKEDVQMRLQATKPRGPPPVIYVSPVCLSLQSLRASAANLMRVVAHIAEQRPFVSGLAASAAGTLGVLRVGDLAEETAPLLFGGDACLSSFTAQGRSPRGRREGASREVKEQPDGEAKASSVAASAPATAFFKDIRKETAGLEPALTAVSSSLASLLDSLPPSFLCVGLPPRLGLSATTRAALGVPGVEACEVTPAEAGEERENAEGAQETDREAEGALPEKRKAAMKARGKEEHEKADEAKEAKLTRDLQAKSLSRQISCEASAVTSDLPSRGSATVSAPEANAGEQEAETRAQGGRALDVFALCAGECGGRKTQGSASENSLYFDAATFSHAPLRHFRCRASPAGPSGLFPRSRPVSWRRLRALLRAVGARRLARLQIENQQQQEAFYAPPSDEWDALSVIHPVYRPSAGEAGEESARKKRCGLLFARDGESSSDSCDFSEDDDRSGDTALPAKKKTSSSSQPVKTVLFPSSGSSSPAATGAASAGATSGHAEENGARPSVGLSTPDAHASPASAAASGANGGLSTPSAAGGACSGSKASPPGLPSSLLASIPAGACQPFLAARAVLQARQEEKRLALPPPLPLRPHRLSSDLDAVAKALWSPTGGCHIVGSRERHWRRVDRVLDAFQFSPHLLQSRPAGKPEKTGASQIGKEGDDRARDPQKPDSINRAVLDAIVLPGNFKHLLEPLHFFPSEFELEVQQARALAEQAALLGRRKLQRRQRGGRLGGGGSDSSKAAQKKRPTGVDGFGAWSPEERRNGDKRGAGASQPFPAGFAPGSSCASALAAEGAANSRRPQTPGAGPAAGSQFGAQAGKREESGGGGAAEKGTGLMCSAASLKKLQSDAANNPEVEADIWQLLLWRWRKEGPAASAASPPSASLLATATAPAEASSGEGALAADDEAGKQGRKRPLAPGETEMPAREPDELGKRRKHDDAAEEGLTADRENGDAEADETNGAPGVGGHVADGARPRRTAARSRLAEVLTAVKGGNHAASSAELSAAPPASASASGSSSCASAGSTATAASATTERPAGASPLPNSPPPGVFGAAHEAATAAALAAAAAPGAPPLKCLLRLLRYYPLSVLAQRLGVHRSTVARWAKMWSRQRIEEEGENEDDEAEDEEEALVASSASSVRGHGEA
ncbi:hypothetical protein BESB_008560 [Besnoitia besnoiti]|uniref:Homeodomain-like domain protein n=1 Tax=Besnoitia besnoiti TaxID=94643 RepID=A0A2A9MMF0_BESBE|nr:hypothetical protein BESB_008560 [Besnoitia besnoiti]PFH38514.1 hypothetical protein BESB_008560 [Besnoitia besnoiti]